MLKFNPQHYLAFAPNFQQKNQANFIISNPSPHFTAAFKIKCTKPDMFFVQPYVGVISPLQQISVHVTSQSKGSIPTSKDVKFQIQYGMLSIPPQNLNKALSSITQQNKQLHVLYAELTGNDMINQHEIKSSTSLKNHNSLKSLDYQAEESKVQDYNYKNDEQKLDYLRHQIDNLQKHKSQLIKASKPNGRKYNLLLVIGVFIIALIIGNLLGKALGLSNISRRNRSRQYKYFGLERLWVGEPQVSHKSWYQFWK